MSPLKGLICGIAVYLIMWIIAIPLSLTCRYDCIPTYLILLWFHVKIFGLELFFTEGTAFSILIFGGIFIYAFAGYIIVLFFKHYPKNKKIVIIPVLLVLFLLASHAGLLSSSEVVFEPESSISSESLFFTEHNCTSQYESNRKAVTYDKGKITPMGDFHNLIGKVTMKNKGMTLMQGQLDFTYCLYPFGERELKEASSVYLNYNRGDFKRTSLYFNNGFYFIRQFSQTQAEIFVSPKCDEYFKERDYTHLLVMEEKVEGSCASASEEQINSATKIPILRN